MHFKAYIVTEKEYLIYVKHVETSTQNINKLGPIYVFAAQKHEDNDYPVRFASQCFTSLTELLEYLKHRKLKVLLFLIEV